MEFLGDFRQMKQETQLRKRIKEFYRSFNQQNWEKCFSFIDPEINLEYQHYADSLERFYEHHGPIRVLSIDLQMHLDEPNKLYGNRSFACGTTKWREGTIQERWVKTGGMWFTRMTGMM